MSQSERLAFILCPLVQSTRSKSSPSAAYFLHSFGCGVWNEFVCLFLCWLEVKITGFKISVTIISSLRLRSKSQRNKNKNRTCYCYSLTCMALSGDSARNACLDRARSLGEQYFIKYIYLKHIRVKKKCTQTDFGLLYILGLRSVCL